MFSLARAFSSSYKITFIVDNEFVLSKSSEISAEGFSTFNTQIKSSSLISQALLKISTAFIHLTSRNKSRILKRIFKRNLSRRNNKINEFLKSAGDLKCIFVYGDRHAGTIELPLLYAADKLKIATVIPPLAFFSREENLLAQRRLNHDCDYPHAWEENKKYYGMSRLDPVTIKRVLYYEPWLTEVLDEMDLLPQNPWTMGGGLAKQVWCDSDNAKNFLTEDGCSESKVKVTGHLSHDDLFQALKTDSKLNGISGRLNIIVALPQLGEHELLSWDQHWIEIDFLLTVLSELKQNLFVSLHPKMKDKKYFELAERHGAMILKERLKEVLPFADIYTSTFSSTVPWAIALGIPTVIFDFYNLNYSFYKNDGLNVCLDKDVYKSLLSKMMNPDYLVSVKSQMNTIKEKYPKIDGKAFNRMKSCLVNLS